jgi:DNA-binding CsgD family transcriptional regulator
VKAQFTVREEERRPGDEVTRISDPDPPNLDAILAMIFLVIVVAGVVDLVLDAPRRLLSLHVAVELALVSVSLGAAVYLARGWLATRTQLGVSRTREAELRQEQQAWRVATQEMLEGLGAEVDRQFSTWELTDAERETALMLLKGFSMIRIAKLTGRSERTVRQHAVAVYRKSGLAGRAELSGFFLGDLLLPTPPSPKRPP